MTIEATNDHLRIPTQLKLAAAWTSFMFLYAYVDILIFYRPGLIDDILAGVVWRLDITQAFVTTALALMAAPILMIALSTLLPAPASRWLNLVVAGLYVPVSVFNIVDESWTYFFGIAIGLEVVVLATILRLAWAWRPTVNARFANPAGVKAVAG